MQSISKSSTRKILSATVCFALAVTVMGQGDSAAFYLQKGLEERTRGRQLEATKALEKAYSFDRLNPQVVNELATSYLEIRMLPSARQKFLEAEKLGTKTKGLYRQLMDLNFNMHQYPDAIRYAQLLKQADPSAKVAFIAGKSYFNQSDWKQSIRFLETAAKEDTSNTEAVYLLAKAHFNDGNFKTAVPHFQKALTRQPKNFQWMFELAMTYYNLEDDENAWNYLVEAREIAVKQDKDYMQNLAITYFNSGKFEESLQTLEEVIADRPKDLELVEFVADFCYSAQKYDEAIKYYNRVLAIDSTKADDLYMIGLAYQKKGEVEKGKQICQKAIAMDPRLRRRDQGFRR